MIASQARPWICKYRNFNWLVAIWSFLLKGNVTLRLWVSLCQLNLTCCVLVLVKQSSLYPTHNTQDTNVGLQIWAMGSFARLEHPLLIQRASARKNEEEFLSLSLSFLLNDSRVSWVSTLVSILNVNKLTVLVSWLTSFSDVVVVVVLDERNKFTNL